MDGQLAAPELGCAIECEMRSVQPIGIRTRQSTEIVAIDDPDIAAAIIYICQHAREGISVGDVLKEVPVSRSSGVT